MSSIDIKIELNNAKIPTSAKSDPVSTGKLNCRKIIDLNRTPLPPAKWYQTEKVGLVAQKTLAALGFVLLAGGLCVIGAPLVVATACSAFCALTIGTPLLINAHLKSEFWNDQKFVDRVSLKAQNMSFSEIVTKYGHKRAAQGHFISKKFLTEKFFAEVEQSKLNCRDILKRYGKDLDAFKAVDVSRLKGQVEKEIEDKKLSFEQILKDYYHAFGLDLLSGDNSYVRNAFIHHTGMNGYATDFLGIKDKITTWKLLSPETLSFIKELDSQKKMAEMTYQNALKASSDKEKAKIAAALSKRNAALDPLKSGLKLSQNEISKLKILHAGELSRENFNIKMLKMRLEEIRERSIINNSGIDSSQRGPVGRPSTPELVHHDIRQRPFVDPFQRDLEANLRNQIAEGEIRIAQLKVLHQKQLSLLNAKEAIQAEEFRVMAAPVYQQYEAAVMVANNERKCTDANSLSHFHEEISKLNNAYAVYFEANLVQHPENNEAKEEDSGSIPATPRSSPEEKVEMKDACIDTDPINTQNAEVKSSHSPSKQEVEEELAELRYTLNKTLKNVTPGLTTEEFNDHKAYLELRIREEEAILNSL